LKEADWSFPQTDTQRIKYLAFKDLWQQDFHLSSGAKFGGDFLVYPGIAIRIANKSKFKLLTLWEAGAKGDRLYCVTF